jgi:hypothetical protein
VLDTRAVGGRKITEIISGTERKMPGSEIATNRGATAMMPQPWQEKLRNPAG